jgi:hypothetical protein
VRLMVIKSSGKVTDFNSTVGAFLNRLKKLKSIMVP